MERDRVIAVLGATGAQGGGVVGSLEDQNEFRVRALTRDPGSAVGIADEVARADLDDLESLVAAFDGAYGVFATINSFGSPDTDEVAQGRRVVEAASQAGVTHFVWSTLPDVSTLSDGRYTVAHFTNKATIDSIVAQAEFPYFTFVEAPFYYQNLLTPWYQPTPGPDGKPTISQPMPSDARCLHVGDIAELGQVVAGAFTHPEVVGSGQHLALAGDLVSWDDIISTMQGLGIDVTYYEDPEDTWGIRDMLGYFTDYTYFGPDADTKIANAKSVSAKPFTDFPTWAAKHLNA
ncbi:MAG: NmrA/HSCARG family protein [Acidimicrobiia bacterium]